MDLYSIRFAPIRSSDFVVRQSRLNRAGGVLAGSILVGVPLLFWGQSPSAAAFFAVWGLLFALVFASDLRHACSPANWLIRCRPDSMLIKFRSYMNSHFPEGDIVVFGLEQREIDWARRTREWRTQPGSQSTKEQVYSEFLDIHVKDTALDELGQRLKEERTRPPMGKWAQRKLHDYPVRVLEGNIIRVNLRVPGYVGVPAFASLARYMANQMGLEVRPDECDRIDLTVDAGERASLEDMTLQLVERGDINGAVRLVRKLYGYPLTRARAFVMELANAPESKPRNPGAPLP